MGQPSRASLAARILLALVTLASAAGCADPAPRTQIIVIVDADQAVRAESEKLRIVVRGGRGETMGGLDDRFFREFNVTPTEGWPVQLGVIPLDGDVGRLFEIEAAGIDAARREVTLVRARSGFAAERTLVLRLQLEDACRGIICREQQTCTSGRCTDVVVIPVDELPPFDPNMGARDAGMPPPVDCTNDDDCDDGVFCNGRERCLDALCAPGVRVVCDDGVSCTRDVCRDNACVGEPDDSACDAGPGGRCAGAMGCQYTECTDTTCASDWMSCETAVCSGTTCMRSSTCGLGDTCCGGTCAPAGCSDGDECTLDSCGATGCVHTARVGATCNDGDTCTERDVCTRRGVCAGATRACDDSNPCSDDSCVVGIGCVNTSNAIPCNDGDACTAGDVCASGACVSGEACDDGIACTVDVCAGAGCSFTPDSSLCTAAAGGTCSATTDCQYATCTIATCVRNDMCDVATCDGATCRHAAVSCASDGNLCTNDVCNPTTGCQNTPNTLPCDDSNSCTLSDTCAGGGCVGTMNPCDDGNSCTSTACSPAVGCTFAPTPDAPCGANTLCERNVCSSAGACQLTATVCSVMITNNCHVASCDNILGCTSEFVDGNSCCDGSLLGVCSGGDCMLSPSAPRCTGSF